jgi:hypothetical protein
MAAKAFRHSETCGLHLLTSDDKDAEFRMSLVPWSMAGDLGEAERKAACETPFVWFTLDEPSPDKWPDADYDGAD